MKMIRILKAIATTDEMYICHYGDPHHPVLIPAVHINRHPSHYYLYPSIVEFTRSSSVDANKDTSRESTSEHALLSFDKDDEHRYNYESLTLNEIYTQISKYTSQFRNAKDKSLAFIYWAKKTRLNFMSLAIKRRRIKDEQNNVISVRTRPLYVLDKKHWVRLVDAIVKRMVIYKANLKTWKVQGYIGDARVKNIQDMMDILHARLGADRVYVSPCTNSTEPIASRDTSANKDMLSSLHQCSGDTQDILKYIRVKKASVVIVCLTYAGFATDPNDLKEFIRYHKNITHIVVDDNSNKNQFHVHSRDQILNKPYIAEKFKCRTSVGPRSK
ncbi:MAG: hypothetical protein EXX96DRAFT_534533 [Benjaminiella poitrasii]|nr:MAG: hypothetical protein EXX96DRAFT_534533 [Benjaminiella poitrasii]